MINQHQWSIAWVQYTPKVPASRRAISVSAYSQVATRIGSFLEHRIHTLHPPQLSFLGSGPWLLEVWKNGMAGTTLTYQSQFGGEKIAGLELQDVPSVGLIIL